MFDYFVDVLALLCGHGHDGFDFVVLLQAFQLLENLFFRDDVGFVERDHDGSFAVKVLIQKLLIEVVETFVAVDDV